MILVDENLLYRFRGPGKCEWCDKHHQARHPHHLLARGMGGGGRLDHRLNLIALCPVCHNEVHCGVIMRCDLLAKVAVREGILQREILNKLYEIRRSLKK
jgi:hypothetical protein